MGPAGAAASSECATTNTAHSGSNHHGSRGHDRMHKRKHSKHHHEHAEGDAGAATDTEGHALTQAAAKRPHEQPQHADTSHMGSGPAKAASAEVHHSADTPSAHGAMRDGPGRASQQPHVASTARGGQAAPQHSHGSSRGGAGAMLPPQSPMEQQHQGVAAKTVSTI